MNLKLTEHVRNTISLLYKQNQSIKQTNKHANKTKNKNKNKKTKKKKPKKQKKNRWNSDIWNFLAKNSILRYLLKIDNFWSAMFYYAIVTS